MTWGVQNRPVLVKESKSIAKESKYYADFVIFVLFVFDTVMDQVRLSKQGVTRSAPGVWGIMRGTGCCQLQATQLV